MVKQTDRCLFFFSDVLLLHGCCCIVVQVVPSGNRAGGGLENKMEAAVSQLPQAEQASFETAKTMEVPRVVETTAAVLRNRRGDGNSVFLIYLIFFSLSSRGLQRGFFLSLFVEAMFPCGLVMVHQSVVDSERGMV